MFWMRKSFTFRRLQRKRPTLMRGKSIEHLLTQTTVFSVWNNKQAIFIHFFPYFVVFSSGLLCEVRKRKKKKTLLLIMHRSGMYWCALQSIKTATTPAAFILTGEISILLLREPVTQCFHVLVSIDHEVHEAERLKTTPARAGDVCVSRSCPSCLMSASTG